MGTNHTEEAIQEYVEEQSREELRTLIKQELRKELESKISESVEKCLVQLEEYGIYHEQEDIDVRGIVREQVIRNLFGVDESEEVAEISVAGRSNRNLSMEVKMDTGASPKTYTEEVPIEGGDVEDPETVEVERIERPADPRLNSDLDSYEISRAFKEGLTPDMIHGEHRVNDDSASDQEDEYDSEDVPAAGLPWYQ